MHRRSLSVWFVLTGAMFSFSIARPCQLAAQRLLSTRPRDRITRFIDDENRVTLAGNRHPMARLRYDVGGVAPDQHMQSMILTLQPDAKQQRALEQLLSAQHNPQSPYYHRWLTPQSFGERFGVSENDLAQVKGWLQLH